MKQSDAAWFSGPGTPFSAGGTSLTEIVRWRVDTDALIQHLAFHRPLSSHTGSAVSRGLGLLQSSIILPRVHRCHGTQPAQLGRVPRWGYRLQRPLPSSSSPSPNLFTSLSSPPAFSPLALPLLHLCNMWKLLGGRWRAECMRWILISIFEGREASPLYRNTVKVSLQI